MPIELMSSWLNSERGAGTPPPDNDKNLGSIEEDRYHTAFKFEADYMARMPFKSKGKLGTTSSEFGKQGLIKTKGVNFRKLAFTTRSDRVSTSPQPSACRPDFEKVVSRAGFEPATH